VKRTKSFAPTSKIAPTISDVARAEAVRCARIEFGSHARFQEQCREALGTHFLEGLLGDIRFAFRMLSKSPGFTSVAIRHLQHGRFLPAPSSCRAQLYPERSRGNAARHLGRVYAFVWVSI
jgi:hypothetical protein